MANPNKKLDDLEVEEKPKINLPSVGRVVHFQPHPEDDHEPWPAIVCKVHPGSTKLVLAVFDPNGLTKFKRDVLYSEKPTAGCWNWPPRH